MRNSILYGSLGLYSGPAGSTGYNFTSGNSGVNLITQLQRVQSVTPDFTINLTDVFQLGDTSELDRLSSEPPTVNFTFDWLVADVSNEKKLGFYISGDQPVIRDIANGTNDDRNFFIAVAPEGVDVDNWTGNSRVIQMTNAYMTSYSVEGSVGSFPTASANFECFNYATNTGSVNVPLKSIVPTGGQLVSNVNFTLPVGVSGINTVSVIRPESITVDVGGGGLGVTGLQVQSFTYGFELARTSLNKLGSFYPYAKTIAFPQTASASVTAFFTDIIESNLKDILCNNPNFDININLYDPSCNGYGAPAVRYTLKQAKLDSQSLSDLTVGNTAASVTLNFGTNVGLGSTKGPFISGSRF